LGQQKVAL